MVGDYFNIKKTTFDFNFDVFPAFEQQEYIKTRKKEKLPIKKASL